jgi:predicted small secreted protein
MNLTKVFLLAIAMVATFALTSCERDTPGEEAGEKIEEAGEKVEDAAD